ncbi:olfactory receptor 7C2-like [Thomomys bottae]
MERQNQTGVRHFLLLGFTEDLTLQPVLFGLFLSMYLITVLGNLLLVLATVSDPRLHTPMYFFLCNLSWVDVGFTSTTVPNMLLNLRTHSQAISYAGCLAQIYFFILFGCLDNLLLTVMAYDRYVAICHPLRYEALLTPRLCEMLALGCWLASATASLPETLTVLRLAFSPCVAIPHFFCDLPTVLRLAHSDTVLNSAVLYCVTLVLAVGPLAGILLSYCHIFSSLLRMSSGHGRRRAFSTCGSHLLGLSLFYGTGLGVYLSSAAPGNPRLSMMASVAYTVVTPMLNPFIYSLRNRDVKGALGRLLA